MPKALNHKISSSFRKIRYIGLHSEYSTEYRNDGYTYFVYLTFNGFSERLQREMECCYEISRVFLPQGVMYHITHRRSIPPGHSADYYIQRMQNDDPDSDSDDDDDDVYSEYAYGYKDFQIKDAKWLYDDEPHMSITDAEYDKLYAKYIDDLFEP